MPSLPPIFTHTHTPQAIYEKQFVGIIKNIYKTIGFIKTMKFEIMFMGHKNIRALHQKTIEITKETSLTPQGDCIVGVGAKCGCADLPDNIKEKLRDPKCTIKFMIKVDAQTFSWSGKGHPDLALTHTTDIVLRKSRFLCPRTLAVECDKASDSIPRTMIKALQNPDTVGRFIIKV